MRIVIDATSLLLQGAGVRTYIHYWLQSLSQHAIECGDRLSLYPLRVPIPNEVDHRKSVFGNLSTRSRIGFLYFLNIPWNPAIELALAGADVFHCSQHTLNLPRWRLTTATIFDLSCWTAPEYHTPENVAATRRYADRILKSADGLIAISEHTRRDAVEILRIPRERIRVIHPGVAEPFFHITAGQIRTSQKKYDLGFPYMLFVGCIEPRKNVPTMIRAYMQLPEALRRDVKLVLAGPFGWEKEETRDLLQNQGEGVGYLGYVPEADLPGLVGGSVAVVYPSFYEGFGLPAAQAMAAGIPVIASDRSCFPEVIGDAGILVDPNSTEELQDAMERVCTGSCLARELGLRGQARAQQFRWSTCAIDTLRFFHNVAA